MYSLKVYISLSQLYCRIFLSAVYIDIVDVSRWYLHVDKYQRKINEIAILYGYEKGCVPCLKFSTIPRGYLWLSVWFNGVEIALNERIGDLNQSTKFQKALIFNQSC